MLAIVGSLLLHGSAEAEARIEAVLDAHRPRRFVSGGAVGIDTMAEAAADRRGIPKTIYPPEQKGWYWYKKRDQLIAADCECLVRIYAGNGRTWGSGWTAREAEKLGARVERFKIGEGNARP